MADVFFSIPKLCTRTRTLPSPPFPNRDSYQHSFPILRLPESALQKSVQLLDVVEQLSLSVLSKNTKQLVAIANKNPHHAYVDLTSSSILFKLWSRSLQLFEFVLKHNQSSVEIRQYTNFQHEKSTELNIRGFTDKKWFDHIADVYFSKKCTFLNITESAGISIDEVCDYTKGLKIVNLRVEYSTIQDCQLHELFPALRNFSVYSQDPIPKSILTQGFESLSVDNMNITLDDLLVSNQPHLSVKTERFSDKDINLFLRHWLKGSNPNLESLSLYRSNREQVLKADIFKGIQDSEISDGGFIKYNPGIRVFLLSRHDGTSAFGEFDSPYSLYISM